MPTGVRERSTIQNPKLRRLPATGRNGLGGTKVGRRVGDGLPDPPADIISNGMEPNQCNPPDNVPKGRARKERRERPAGRSLLAKLPHLSKPLLRLVSRLGKLWIPRVLCPQPQVLQAHFRSRMRMVDCRKWHKPCEGPIRILPKPQTM